MVRPLVVVPPPDALEAQPVLAAEAVDSTPTRDPIARTDAIAKTQILRMKVLPAPASTIGEWCLSSRLVLRKEKNRSQPITATEMRCGWLDMRA
jgi:hypothetical protein